MKKALIIHPRGIDDLGDLLAIARAEGKKAFRTKELIHVHPEVVKMEGCYLVVVEADGIGRTDNQVQEKDDGGA